MVNSNKYLKLNVGGSLHYTTMGTLTKEDNMLRAMFSGRMVVLTDSEGAQSQSLSLIFIKMNFLKCLKCVSFSYVRIVGVALVEEP